jgi:hypothetical protein
VDAGASLAGPGRTLEDGTQIHKLRHKCGGKINDGGAALMFHILPPIPRISPNNLDEFRIDDFLISGDERKTFVASGSNRRQVEWVIDHSQVNRVGDHLRFQRRELEAGLGQQRVRPEGKMTP